jgi:hypothetical protein
MKRKLVLIAAALALAGCEILEPHKQEPAQTHAAASKPAAPVQARANTPVVPPVPPELPPARKALNAGIDMYKAGNFNGAIKQLTAPEMASAETPLQLEAIKYTAFSYCVTNRITLCRQQFIKAFKLDPDFDLSPGEKGHPLWTPSFERARKEAGKKKK